MIVHPAPKKEFVSFSYLQLIPNLYDFLQNSFFCVLQKKACWDASYTGANWCHYALQTAINTLRTVSRGCGLQVIMF